MNNKQLGRKFATENINATATRETIALVEGFSAIKLVNASDDEVIDLFVSLLRNMKNEVVSEMVENYEQAKKTLKIENIGACGVWYYENQKEFNNAIEELEENPDFELFTVTQNLEQIIEEFEYQGVDIDKLTEMTANHYGNIVEIIFNSAEKCYMVYVGAR